MELSDLNSKRDEFKRRSKARSEDSSVDEDEGKKILKIEKKASPDREVRLKRSPPGILKLKMMEAQKNSEKIVDLMKSSKKKN